MKRLISALLITTAYIQPVYADSDNVVILSSGSNYGNNPIEVIQPQLDATVVAIKTRMPDAKIIMVIPLKYLFGYSTMPSTAATAVAEKYGITQVVFTDSIDKIHPSNYVSVVDQIRKLTSVPPNRWYVVGDSIAFGIVIEARASGNYSLDGMTPKFILENFVPLLPQTVITATSTQQGINAVKNDSQIINSIVSSRVTGALNNSCNGEYGCVSISFGNDRSDIGNLKSGSINLSKTTDSSNFGVSFDKSFTSSSTETVFYKPNNPLIGGFIGWNNNNFNITVSYAAGSGNYIITRPLQNNSEAGYGQTKVASSAYQSKMSYTIPFSTSLFLTPYTGVRYTKLSVNGYTESRAIFPLTVNPYNQKSIDLLAGVAISKGLTDSISVNTSIGLSKNLKTNSGSINGQSDISNLNTFNSSFTKVKSVTFGTSAGINYQINPKHLISLNAGFEQKSLINPKVSSIGITYTYGF